MADSEYFLQVLPPEHPAERPLAMWRRTAGRWEHFSSLDWTWHPFNPRQVTLPPPEQLISIDQSRAERLAADRQFWVRYWAVEERPPPAGTGQPYTVARIRTDAAGESEESFGRDNTWIHDNVIASSRWGELTPVREIDRAEAEAILQRVRGVTGATEL